MTKNLNAVQEVSDYHEGMQHIDQLKFSLSSASDFINVDHSKCLVCDERPVMALNDYKKELIGVELDGYLQNVNLLCDNQDCHNEFQNIGALASSVSFNVPTPSVSFGFGRNPYYQKRRYPTRFYGRQRRRFNRELMCAEYYNLLARYLDYEILNGYQLNRLRELAEYCEGIQPKLFVRNRRDFNIGLFYDASPYFQKNYGSRYVNTWEQNRRRRWNSRDAYDDNDEPENPWRRRSIDRRENVGRRRSVSPISLRGGATLQIGTDMNQPSIKSVTLHPSVVMIGGCYDEYERATPSLSCYKKANQMLIGKQHHHNDDDDDSSSESDDEAQQTKRHNDRATYKDMTGGMMPEEEFDQEPSSFEESSMDDIPSIEDIEEVGQQIIGLDLQSKHGLVNHISELICSNIKDAVDLTSNQYDVDQSEFFELLTSQPLVAQEEQMIGCACSYSKKRKNNKSPTTNYSSSSLSRV